MKRSELGSNHARAIFVFLFLAGPGQGRSSRTLRPSEFADIYCWISSRDLASAEIEARAQIAEAGWQHLEIVEVRRVERSDYEGGSTEALFYYDDAVLHGATVVVWTHEDEAGEICPLHGPAH